MGNFKILSYEEEKRLSKDDKIKYYIELKQYLAGIKYSPLEKLSLSFSEKINKNFVRNIVNDIKRYDLYVVNQENIPEGPVIYASTHQDFYDHVNIVLAIPDHAIILNSRDVPKSVKLIMSINKAEYVDRSSPESRFNSKINLMKYLAKGKSVIVYPEGTLNCSLNKPTLPLHGGVIDMAKKMQAPIVPTVQEYNFDNSRLDGKNRVIDCTIEFGKPIYVDFEDNPHIKRDELTDALTTIRYGLIEKKGIHKRKDYTDKEYISFLLSRIHTMELMGVDYQTEENTIYGVNDEFYKYFPINAVFPRVPEETVSSRKEKRRLKKYGMIK